MVRGTMFKVPLYNTKKQELAAAGIAGVMPINYPKFILQDHGFLQKDANHQLFIDAWRTARTISPEEAARPEEQNVRDG